MHSFSVYQIEVQGKVREEQLNAVGPQSVHVTGTTADVSTLVIRADQSGMIGLIRHLHGQGFLILSLCRNG